MLENYRPKDSLDFHGFTNVEFETTTEQKDGKIFVDIDFSVPLSRIDIFELNEINTLVGGPFFLIEGKCLERGNAFYRDFNISFRLVQTGETRFNIIEVKTDIESPIEIYIKNNYPIFFGFKIILNSSYVQEVEIYKVKKETKYPLATYLDIISMKKMNKDNEDLIIAKERSINSRIDSVVEGLPDANNYYTKTQFDGLFKDGDSEKYLLANKVIGENREPAVDSVFSSSFIKEKYAEKCEDASNKSTCVVRKGELSDYYNKQESDANVYKKIGENMKKVRLVINCVFMNNQSRNMVVALEKKIRYPIAEWVYIDIEEIRASLEKEPLAIDIDDGILYESDRIGFIKVRTEGETNIRFMKYVSLSISLNNLGELPSYNGVKYEGNGGSGYFLFDCDYNDTNGNVVIDEVIENFVYNSLDRGGHKKRYLVKFDTLYFQYDERNNFYQCTGKTLYFDIGRKIRKFTTGGSETRYGFHVFPFSNIHIPSLTLESNNYDGRNLFANVKYKRFYAPSIITYNYTYMNYIFSGCSNLEYADLSNFDTHNVKEMKGMFSYCVNLKILDLSSFDLSKVEDMDFMFENCNSLQIVYMSDDTFEKVKSELPGGEGIWTKEEEGKYVKKQTDGS